MSKAPHLREIRTQTQYGNVVVKDSILTDGMTDFQSNMLMGSCVEKISSEMEINRQAQDEYAIQSYTRARQASNQGVFDWEIVEVIQ